MGIGVIKDTLVQAITIVSNRDIYIAQTIFQEKLVLCPLVQLVVTTAIIVQAGIHALLKVQVIRAAPPQVEASAKVNQVPLVYHLLQLQEIL